MYEAKFYQKLENKSVKCDLCHHACVIEVNQTGICHTRINKKGTLFSLVYGYPIAVNIDPIEKKPLYHFHPGSVAYSLGTYGCNFGCANCQNSDISQAEKIDRSAAKLDYLSPARVVEDALGNDCGSIAYTYNEPTVFAEYALETMRLAHEHGLANVWVSNGYMSRVCLDAVLPYLDAVNIDIKSIDPEFYLDNCQARLEPVLENAELIKREQVHLEVTTLVIPGLSDDIGMLERLADFLVTELNDDTPWHISKFSPEISWKLKDLPVTGDDVIYEAHEIGKSAGLKYVYVGNIPGDQKENTYCPKCGELAIRRMGYHIERMDIRGRCAHCDRSLDIIE